MMRIVDVNHGNIAAVDAFLTAHLETCMFLASNLVIYGPALGNSLNSGNFKALADGNEIVGVLCLARRGNLLVETAGRVDLLDAVVDAALAEPIAILGVIGEWCTAEAVARKLTQRTRFVLGHSMRETLLALDLPTAPTNRLLNPSVRPLTVVDFDRFDQVYCDSCREIDLPIQGAREERRAVFEETVGRGFWWGFFEDDALLGTVAINAVHRGVGQVGGVYVIPERRRQGIARAAMRRLIADGVHRHGLKRLILFTGEDNTPALRLYDGLGFTRIGSFGLLFGV